VLVTAVVAYVVAAWMVTPGFYDGIAPPSNYRWVSPPPQFRSTNQPPLAGGAAIRVSARGTVDPGNVSTGDAQATLGFAEGTFVTPADRSPVRIDIRPVASFPDPGNVHIATNVYCVTSSSAMAAGRDGVVTLQYSGNLPAPSDVYEYQPGGAWQKVGSTGAASPYYVAARATALGCFAGGYPANAKQAAQGATLGGGQALPILVAVVILIVVLAGIPLAVLRRRGSDDDADDG
jgi:hypothetical protein